MPEKTAQSRELAYNTWVDPQGYVLSTGKQYSYESLRALLGHPIVSRAAHCVIQAIAAHKWKVNAPDNPKAEEWINLVMRDIGDRMIRKAVGCILFGHQEAELYYPEKIDGRWWPAVAYPPQDFITIKVDENWNYAGYKQRQPDKPIEVSAEESVLWTWGDWGGNPYGKGVLETVYAYAANHSKIMDNITTMTTRQNWPLGMVGVPSDGRASQSSIDDFAKDIAALPEKEVPWVGYKQYSQNPISLITVQPVSGAVDEASRAAMDLVRMIAAGMITPLRILVSPGDEGSSYSLAQVQMSEHDRMITGMWNYIMPGITDLIGMILQENFGDVDYTFDLEYIDEQSLRAARDTLNEMLRQGVGFENIDTPALVDMAGIPARSDDVHPSSSTETVGERSRAVGDKTKVLALARKVKRELDSYYDRHIEGLTDRIVADDKPLGEVKSAVGGATGNAKAVYVRNLGKLPTLQPALAQDYDSLPRRLVSHYKLTLEGITEDLESMRLRFGTEYVKDKWERKHREQARKLADRALKSGHYYLGDLQRG